MKKKFANIGKVILSLHEKHKEAQRLAAVHKLDNMTNMPIYSMGQLVYLLNQPHPLWQQIQRKLHPNAPWLYT